VHECTTTINAYKGDYDDDDVVVVDDDVVDVDDDDDDDDDDRDFEVIGDGSSHGDHDGWW